MPGVRLRTRRCAVRPRGAPPGVTRERYEEATDAGDPVIAHVVRGAIHVLAPGDLALYGRALLANDDD